jgi:hypothetical protein
MISISRLSVLLMKSTELRRSDSPPEGTPPVRLLTLRGSGRHGSSTEISERTQVAAKLGAYNGDTSRRELTSDDTLLVHALSRHDGLKLNRAR